MDVAVGDTLSHYRLLERVDGGGQGTVWKAKDLRLDRDVALKVLPEHALADQDARRRFQKEARALSLLSHPNIQVIHDFDTQNGVDFLVSEYIPGLTLKEKLSSNGSFSEQDLARLGLQITEGLACAHEHGVVHRDLSAKNLILTSDGHLKIVDFGLARFVRLPSETETTETLTASIAGTLPYMSPEQLAGHADARSDIYGLGVLLYQMATGRFPFAGLQGPALIAAIHTQPPPPPTRMNPRLSARMEDVLLKCLEKDPERRYQSARELAVDFRRVLEPRTVLPPRPHRLLWAFPGLLILLGLLVTAKETKFWPFTGGFRFDHPAMAAVANSPVKEQGSRISPDGVWISFLGDRSGKPTLWRRHVSGGEPEAIVTESGNILSQAWSPDGLEMAYLHLVNGEVLLKIQSAFGGPASTVMPVNVRYKDAKIARWIGSGLFLDVPRSGLWRLDRRTGKEANVLASVSNAEYREQFDVSSDGKNATYVNVEGSQTSIWISRLNGKEARPITRPGESVSAPRWLGHRGVMYVSDRGGQPDIWFHNQKGEGVRQITFSTAAEDLEDVSADGALVTFTLESESGGLWKMNLKAAERGTQVTPGSPVDFWPVQASDKVVFQKMKPGMEGAAALFNNGIYIAPLNALNSPDESRLIVEQGAFPLPSPSGRYVTFMREPATRGWELWVHDLAQDHDLRLSDDFHPPDLFIQPLSFLSVNEAWSPSGDSLFAVGLLDRAPVIRQFLMRSPETPTVLARADKGQTLSNLFVSPDGSQVAYVIGTSGTSHPWEIHVCDLIARTDTVWFTDPGADFQRFLVRGWLGRDRLLALRVHINPDWTNRLDFLEVSQNRARSLSTVDNAFDGTVQIDRATGVIYLVRLDEPGGSANIYSFDPARDRLIRITNNTSPSITFAGLDLSNPGSLFYSMVDHNQDIWRVEFEGNKRSRKERD